MINRLVTIPAHADRLSAGCVYLAIAFAVVLPGQSSHAQQSPGDSLKSLQPAAGLEVSLWASEPLVNNPTSMDIDSRGRVWVSEGLNYRMQQREFDQLKRVDGADRIKILSDTNGDGRADSVTVFADDLFPVPLGLAVEEIWADGRQTGTRVYIGHSPDLLVLEDTDGDDRADRRYALLSGFRGVDSDHGLHGMTFGPDGKLYFTVGDARYGADRVQAREPTFDVTDRSGRRLSSNNFGTTLRVNRDGTQLEVLTSGHRNNYEAAVDSFGNVFGSDNDDDGNRGSRMYWVIDGGNYGYQHPKSNRHWAEELPGIIPKLVGTGNGAPGGLTVYEGQHLPERYFGAVLQIDSGTRQVNAHPLHRHGAGFRTDYEVVLKGEDDWFRPVDVAVAPDGSVFVCDWYDAGVGGNRFSDQTTGRIYRLSAQPTESTSKRPALGDTADSVAGLLADLQSPNTVTRLAARDRLVTEGATVRPQLLTLFRQAPAHVRARVLHVLDALPGTEREDVLAALSDPDPRIRETAVQLLARDTQREWLVASPEGTDLVSPAMTYLDQLLPLTNDPDAGVRRALLMALRNVPSEELGDALLELADRWDGRDRYYLEAVRAALVDRSTADLNELFDRLAERAIDAGWDNHPIAVPPYYPIGTNDAFLRPDDTLPPSNSAGQVIGLAWALQRHESLPAMTKILAANDSPSVEQAATIALSELDDSRAGQLLIERYSAGAVDVSGRREILKRLGRRLDGPWQELADTASLKDLFAAALQDPALQQDAITAIARGGLTKFGPSLLKLAHADTVDVPVRAAAVAALGDLQHQPAQAAIRQWIDVARNQSSGGPIALAALDANTQLGGAAADDLLVDVLTSNDMPLDVRRRALQLLTASIKGVQRILPVYREGSFPRDLNGELSFLLHNHADRRIRQLAEEALPHKVLEGGKKIHDVQTVLALQGDPDRGRQWFATHQVAACARCHHVDGSGTLVGPDLSSIGMKYGPTEILYHIQYPSGAINYNFVAHTFLLEDGRVLSGLVIDRQDGQITMGIATGQHVTFAADEVESERAQNVSLMPEGLVADFSSQQLADLVEYLLTLRHGDAVSSTPPAQQP
ncbi:PVC-type heme-binding CxxCH protein [Novipirellula sp. SH528]|uniref:PVC-type heme-binding CxxCH protein n=1 Tax=Novipirellula sp. SH528 TaxID=3454466 RepID=UPI003F9FB6C7